jgi:hypothetical protein
LPSWNGMEQRLAPAPAVLRINARRAHGGRIWMEQSTELMGEGSSTCLGREGRGRQSLLRKSLDLGDRAGRAGYH